jgi:hypothetical protein
MVDPRIPGPAPAELLAKPNTPLSAYAPGQLAQMSPEERGKALKRKKGVSAGAALTMPASVLAGPTLEQ